MKIRDKILITASVSFALMIALGFLVYATSQEINKAEERSILSQNIVTDVFELNLLRAEYVINPAERPKIQWLSKYESLGKNIKKAEEEEEEEEGAVLKATRQNYNDLKPLFAEVVSYTENPGNKSQELGDSLRGQMLIKSQEIVSVSRKLGSIASANVLSATQKIFYVVIAVIVAGIALAINSLFLLRSVVIPIKKLHWASEALARKEFDTRVNIKTGDEMEQLGKSFNKTLEALGKLDRERREIENAKIQFIAISSHELRSPMTPMKANLQMLLQDYFGKLNKKQKETLEAILRNTNRLDRIIVDLLEVSRIQAARLKINPVKANLVKETKTLLEEMRNYLPDKKIEIVSEIGKLPAVETDPDKVNQILRNLIGNAKKFSRPKSKIFVSAEIKDKNILFSVKDNGIGIPNESQKRIFEPFFQSEQTMYREHEGTGLGLTICKGIAEALGGKIWFESQAGKGSTFYFTIPLKRK